MLTNSRKSQSGLSLVELMIAMVVGFIIVGAALYVGTSSMKSSRDNIRMSFLNQELRNVLNLVSRDLKRASYWGPSMDAVRVASVTGLTFGAVAAGSTGVSIAQSFKTSDVTDTVVDRLGNAAVGSTLVYLESGNRYRATITGYNAGTNTYTATLVDTFPNTVLAANGGAPKNTWAFIGPAPAITLGTDCVTFSYDQDGDGLVTTSNPDERIGYQLNSGVIEARQGGTGCAGGGWANITDQNAVQITSFTITDDCAANPSSCSITGGALTSTMREYTIVIRGRLTRDTAVQREVRETVRVRNNQIS